MRNVKKVTQVAYMENVMIMIIDLNIDLCFLTFYHSSATANQNPSSSATANQNARQDRHLTIFKSSLQNKTRIFGELAPDISIRWVHLFFYLVCSSPPIR